MPEGADADYRSPSSGVSSARLPEPARIALGLILCAALAIRVASFVQWPGVIFPDETFQYLEQAHRLAFGSGLVPWEFQVGMRSWLLPGALAGLMRVVHWIDADPWTYIVCIRLLCATLSLSVVYIAFRLAWETGGLVAAVLAGAFAALWFEAVYFAPVVMPDVLGAHVALWGIYLGSRSDGEAFWRTFLVGAMLGLAVCLRIQLAPAVAAAALWMYRLDFRRWRLVVLGGLAVVVPVLGALDWITWGAPFQTVWLYVVRNVVNGVSEYFGVEPWDNYLHMVWWSWTPLALPLAALAVAGVRRAPALAVAALATVIALSCLGHKEYRFIYLALAIAPILMGLGAAELVAWTRRRRGAAAAMAVGIASLMYFAGASAYGATHGYLADRWGINASNLRAFLAAHRTPDICGLGVAVRWDHTGGYTYLDRAVPLLMSEPPRDERVKVANTFVSKSRVSLLGHEIPIYPNGALMAHSDRFNALIAPVDAAPPGFFKRACFPPQLRDKQPEICLFVRAGHC